MNARNIFTELKRRNVYKVAVAYAVVGWLLIQVGSPNNFTFIWSATAFAAESLRKAISFAQEAVRLDPNYALAYAKLGQAWRQYAASFATDDISKAYDEARRAADQAVSLVPDLEEARMTVGLLAFTPGLDFAAAEKEFRRVLQSSPNNAAAKNALTFSLLAQGRLTEAEETCREALSLDPS